MTARDRSRSPRSFDNTEEIVRLVATREQARLQKDWSLADTLRTQLSTMGVTLFDKTASWRTSDGKSGRIPTFNEIDGGNLETTIAQQVLEIQSQQSSSALLGSMGAVVSFGTDSESQIKTLIQQREQARANKDFTRSDEIREELKAMGVEVFDKEKMWRATSGASGVILGYHARGGPTDLEITTLVVQREKVRQSGDFGTSDMIRNELRAVGVEIYDKEKIWKASDGRQGPVPSWQQVQSVGGNVGNMTSVAVTQPAMVNAMAGMAAVQPLTMMADIGGGAAATATSLLQKQVIEAAIAASKTPAAAAQTLALLQASAAAQLLQGGGGAQLQLGAQLFQGGGVSGGGVGAQLLQSVSGGNTAAPKGSLSMDAGAVSAEYQQALTILAECASSGRVVGDDELTWLIGVREKLRYKKEFQAADDLRNTLRNSLSVELHEKEKRWTTSDGRQGAIPMFSDLA